MVDGEEVDGGEVFLKRVWEGRLGAVPWEEDAGVGVLLDERVRCVAVGADCGDADRAVGVGDGVWF